MAVVSGDTILASTWNTHARSSTRESFYIKVSGDKTGTASFWMRSAGWNWPDFYNSILEYATGFEIPSANSLAILQDDLMAEEVSGQIIAYKAQKDYPALPPSTNDDDIEWSSYRWEYDVGGSYSLGDEVVFGGGLFTVKVAGPLVATPPVIPKYGDIANSDANYTRTMLTNVSVRLIREGVRIEEFYLELIRPGVGTNIRVYSRERPLDDDQVDAIWLSPGEYHVIYDFEDFFSLGSDKTSVTVTSKAYDDNVKQWSELRVFNSTLSDLSIKGATKLLASSFNSSPRATDFDIDKKGGTATTYTGDW